MLDQQPKGQTDHEPLELECPPAAWQPDNSLRWWADSLQKAYDDTPTSATFLGDAVGVVHAAAPPTIERDLAAAALIED